MQLTRVKTTSQASYWELEVDDFKCKAIGLPYRGNKRNTSSIPLGTYKYRVLNKSKAFRYRHIWIMNVPGRDGIKIHVGNFVSQLRGCFAVGSEFVDLDNDGIIDVKNSSKTLKELLQVIPETGEIIIQ